MAGPATPANHQTIDHGRLGVPAYAFMFFLMAAFHWPDLWADPLFPACRQFDRWLQPAPIRERLDKSSGRGDGRQRVAEMSLWCVSAEPGWGCRRGRGPERRSARREAGQTGRRDCRPRWACRQLGLPALQRTAETAGQGRGGSVGRHIAGRPAHDNA